MGIYKPLKIILIYFLIHNCMGQEISFKLDSIHKLSGSNYEKLTQYYQLFDIHKENEDFTQLGSDAHQVGRWLFYKEKKWKEALAATKIAYEAREKATPFNAELLKRSYFNYANFHKLIGKHAIAIRYFRKMLEVKGSDFFHAKAYGLIGSSYSKIGDPYQAIENQLQAFTYFDPIKDKIFIISNHINIGITYKNIRTQKSFSKAISHLLTADSLIHTVKNPRTHDLYAINNNLGDMYYKKVGQKNDIKAIAYFEKALELAQEMKIEKNLAQVNFNLGMIYNKSNTTLAEYYFNTALSYIKDNKGAAYLIPKILRGLGQAAFAQGNYTKAHEYYRKSFSKYFNQEIIDPDWLPSKKDLELTYIREKSVFLELLKLKTQTYMVNAKKENDSVSYKNVIRTVKVADIFTDHIMKENLSYRSKLVWRSLTSQIFAIGLDACYQLADIETAFYFMEKNKALLLTQEVVKNNINLPGDILEKKKKLESMIIRQQRRFTKASIAKKDSLSAVILSQRGILQQFKDSLALNYPSHFSATSNPKILPLVNIKPQKNEVIIQYTIAESVALTIPQTHGIIITNNDTHLFKIRNTKKLLDNVYDLRKRLNHPFKTSTDISTYKKVAHELYNQLFPEKIQALLKDKNVTIIPDRQLSFIPFEALVTDKDLGTYLIENTEINYVYSLSFQKENASINRQHENEFLGVAPINFSNGLSTLSKSKQEIDNAKKYYKGSSLINTQAIKDNFTEKADSYKILHLATHADASDSIAPWIAFHDTKLTIDEINISETSAELVVLSACNTSLGEITHGEGVLSLARGFFASGANTVIPSLWSTNDKTTTTITSSFYKNLSEGKTKSEALRMAKLKYLNNHTDAEASPHYWAPLILIGDSTTLLPTKEYNVIQIVFMVIIGIIICMVSLYFFCKRKNNYNLTLL